MGPTHHGLEPPASWAEVSLLSLLFVTVTERDHKQNASSPNCLLTTSPECFRPRLSLRRDGTWNIWEEIFLQLRAANGTWPDESQPWIERETLHRHVPRLVKTPNRGCQGVRGCWMPASQRLGSMDNRRGLQLSWLHEDKAASRKQGKDPDVTQWQNQEQRDGIRSSQRSSKKPRPQSSHVLIDCVGWAHGPQKGAGSLVHQPGIIPYL